MTFAAPLLLTQGATYGELFAFADAARAAGVDAGSRLSYATDAGVTDHLCVVGIASQPTSLRPPVHPVSHQLLGQFIALVNDIEDAGGDATAVLEDLLALRDEIVEDLQSRKTIHG